MLYDEKAVRDNIRNREGKRVFFLGSGDVLTPSAKDYLLQQHIPVLSGQEAKIEQYQLLTGGFVNEKPEHFTHLYGNVLVPKTHPRIAFRGAIDTLEAELLLCQQIAGEELRKKLQEVLTLARNLIRWDVLNEPAQVSTLCGLTEEEIRKRSHFPQNFYNQPHFMPEVSDGAVILQLNRARALARQAELKAVDAFLDREGNPTRPDILTALNRISSMLYVLMIEEKAQKGK